MKEIVTQVTSTRRPVTGAQPGAPAGREDRTLVTMRLRIRGLAAVAVLGLAACSGGDDEATSGEPLGVAVTERAPISSAEPAPSTAGDPPATSMPPSTSAATTSTTTPPGADDYPDQPAGVPFPAIDWPTGELPEGIDRAAIDDAVDTAFGAPDATARLRSVVVVHGGQIVYERYHPLDGAEVVYDSFSVAKSFTSALIGLLVDDGRMDLDEHPARPEWPPGDPRTAIALRDLLQMSSGLTWAEEYSPASMPLRMITAPDAAHYVADQPLEAEPGTHFEYSTGTTALLVGLAADELGGCEQANAFFEQRLLDPIGITSEELMLDGRGCWLGGLGANMTTRDFARFGLLYLRGGTWDGEQILSTDWIDETRVPAPAQPGYGLQWWLGADGTSFSAEGLFGQRIIVVPEDDLVIAMNTTQGGDSVTPADVTLAQFAALGG